MKSKKSSENGNSLISDDLDDCLAGGSRNLS